MTGHGPPWVGVGACVVVVLDVVLLVDQVVLVNLVELDLVVEEEVGSQVLEDVSV